MSFLFVHLIVLCCTILHDVSEKKNYQPILYSVLVKYEPISTKIGRHVQEETLNKTIQKLPTLLKICASTTLGNLK